MAQLVAGTISGVFHYISMQLHWRIAYVDSTLVVRQDVTLSHILNCNPIYSSFNMNE